MADDWQLFDLAECIRDDWAGSFEGDPVPPNPPRVGQVFTVARLKTIEWHCGRCDKLHKVLLLGFFGCPHHWDSAHFRKVRPTGEDAEIDRWATWFTDPPADPAEPEIVYSMEG